MKQNEIIPRQNRVVYTLLIVVAALGLVWAVWKHQHMAHEPMGTPAAPAAAAPPARPAG